MEQVQPQGTPPTARAYHTFNTMGDKCFVVGGRTTQSTLLARDQVLCMYDVTNKQWVSPGSVSGSFPARSSHRGIVVGGNQLVICGGAGQGKLRMNDSSVLKQGSNGHLSWRRLSVSPFQPGGTPLADCHNEDMSLKVLLLLLCCRQNAVCGLSATPSTGACIVHSLRPSMQSMLITVALFDLLLLERKPCLALLDFICFATCDDW